MTDDRSDPDAASPQGSSRKPRPPVIELKATDVTPETPAAAEAAKQTAEIEAATEAAASPAPDAAASATTEAAARQGAAASGTESAAEQPAATGARRGLPAVAIAAAIGGAFAGALALVLVLLFGGDSVRDRLLPAATGTQPAADAGALADRIERLDRTIAEAEKRFAALEHRAQPAVDLAPLAASLNTSLNTSLGTSLNASLAASLATSLAPLTARLDGVEKSLGELRRLAEQTQASAAAASRTLNERVAALEGSLKQAADASSAKTANGAAVVALGALRDAVTRGTPFTKELQVAQAMLGGDDAVLAALTALTPVAAQGVPTMAALRAQFTALLPQLVHDDQPNEGYLARLMSSASRLVEVRPVGEVAGAGAGAVGARIEARLARNDLAAALDEAAGLPTAAKAAAAGWIAAATRRRDAERAVNGALQAALAQAAAERKP